MQFTFGEVGSEIDFEFDIEGIITFSFVVILGILLSSERRANLISELFCGLNIRVRFASSTLRSRFGAAQIFTFSTFLEITSALLNQRIDVVNNWGIIWPYILLYIRDWGSYFSHLTTYSVSNVTTRLHKRKLYSVPMQVFRQPNDKSTNVSW